MLFLTLIILFCTILVSTNILAAPNTSNELLTFDENLMSQLEKEGYEKTDLIKATIVAHQFDLPLRTILDLKPDGFEWDQVETALKEMIEVEKDQIKNDPILLSLNEAGFTEKEIALIVYISSLYNKDLGVMAKKAIDEVEKNGIVKEGENHPFNSIQFESTSNSDFPMMRSLSTTSSTSTEIKDPGYGYNVGLSSPFATLMKNNTEAVNPATGTLMLMETDLVLPGKNGLDFSLTRLYRSEKAELDRIKADSYGNKSRISIENTTYGGNYLENVYHLGVGWGFDLPSIDIDGDNLILHLGQGQTYQIDWNNAETGLKDIKIKEYIIEKYSNANVESASYLLKNKSGINYYFDSEGNIIQIANRYGDKITFAWTKREGYYYLDQVVDSVNRTLSFTYTESLVIVKLESVSSSYQINYYKEPIGGGHHKLSRIELPEQVQKSYSYEKKSSVFGYMIDVNTYYPKTNQRDFLLLTECYNPYQGKSVYDYNSYRRNFDSYGGYEEYYKIVNRYDYGNGQKQNEIEYEYITSIYGNPTKTTIYHYGNKDSMSYSKKETLSYNSSNHLNEKIEIEIADQPNYKEIKTVVYNDEDKPELIKTEKKDLLTGNSVVDLVDIDYDEYGSVVYQGDSAGRETKFGYEMKTNGEFKYQVLDERYEQINPFGGSKPEYRKGIYSYDSFGNITSIKEQEINASSAIVTENLASKRLTKTGDKLLRELPGRAKEVTFRIYYFAAAPGGNADFEVRYWIKGDSRPTEYYNKYVREGAVFNSHSGYINFTLTLPQNNTYYVEILATKVGAFGSNVFVERMDVTYEQITEEDSLTKSTIYNHYADPTRFGLPNVVHTEFGDTSTHHTDYSNDQCIEVRYKYDHSGVDGSSNGENYDNIFPTEIVQVVANADGYLEGIVTNVRYDRFGNITKITKDDLVIYYEYDQIHRLTKERYQEAESGNVKKELQKTYGYAKEPDWSGLFVTTIRHQDHLGNGFDEHVTRFKYNTLGQYVETWSGPNDQGILVGKVEYDNFGRKKVVKDGEGAKTEYEYDGFSRVKEIIDPSHTKKILDYSDAERKVTTEIKYYTTALGKSVQYLNEAGQVERIDQYPSATESTYYTTNYTYNLEDQMTSMTDHRGIMLKYDYDFYGLKGIDYPGTIRNDDEFVYNFYNKTRQIKQLRNGGKYMIIDQDEMDRVREQQFPDGRTLKNYYDHVGRLSITTLNSSVQNTEIAYYYHLLGSVKKAIHTYDGRVFAVDFGYDEKGQLININYPNNFSISYEYDKYGRVIRIPGFVEGSCTPPWKPNPNPDPPKPKPGDPVIDDPDPITTFSINVASMASTEPSILYLNNGFMTNLSYANGIETIYTPDGAGRIKRIKNNVMDFRYDYDGKGNVEELSSYHPTNGSLNYRYSYTYNDLDWLKEANHGSNRYVYDYDSAGNRTKKTINGRVTDYTYSPSELNLVTAINGASISYDPWGNMIGRENGYKYVFNDSNQLVEVLKNGRTVGKYYYNSEGKRYKKVEGSTTTYYVYSGENILYEEKSDGTKIYYVYLNGRQIAKVEDKNGVRKKYFYHTDHLGSTRAVTGEEGNVVGYVSYKPFGDEQPYFSGRDKSLPTQSSLDDINDIFGRITGTKELSTDRIEGNYSIKIKIEDDPYNFSNFHLTNESYLDTELRARYLHFWVKPEEGAEWMQMAFHDKDDPNLPYEGVLAEDGEDIFRVGEELVKDRWNLVLIDTREGHVDGIDKGSEWISIQTDEFSQWKWDYIGVSVKDPVTFTGKQQDDPTGLYYFNARYYDPNLGRFISEDPVRDGANWYIYCANNPLRYVDPTGETVYAVDFGGQAAWVLGIEGGITVAVDTTGELAGFGHIGFQWQIGASASGGVGIIVSPTMEKVTDLKGGSIWFGASYGAGIRSRGVNYGISFSGDKMFEYTEALGKSKLPFEGHVYIDWTKQITESINLTEKWANYKGLSVRAEDGVIYLRSERLGRSYVMSDNKIKVYQYGGNKSGMLIDMWEVD